MLRGATRRARDQGRPIKILVGKPDIQGVYFYRDDYGFDGSLYLNGSVTLG